MHKCLHSCAQGISPSNYVTIKNYTVFNTSQLLQMNQMTGTHQQNFVSILALRRGPMAIIYLCWSRPTLEIFCWQGWQGRELVNITQVPYTYIFRMCTLSSDGITVRPMSSVMVLMRFNLTIPGLSTSYTCFPLVNENQSVRLASLHLDGYPNVCHLHSSV